MLYLKVFILNLKCFADATRCYKLLDLFLLHFQIMPYFLLHHELEHNIFNVSCPFIVLLNKIMYELNLILLNTQIRER